MLFLLLNNLLCCFNCKHSRAVTNSDVSVSNVHGRKPSKRDVNRRIRRECGVCKTHAVNVQFPRVFSHRKYIFMGSISSQISGLCNNSDQTWFSNPLKCARSRGNCLKPKSKTEVFYSSRGTGQILMHRKPCLNPIVLVGLGVEDKATVLALVSAELSF